MSGILLALIRLAEPYVFKQLYHEFLNLGRKCKFCKKQKKITKIEKIKFSNEALCSFVNSAMNIEFVYIILLGINNFMD